MKMRNIRKGMGVAYSTWLGHIDKEIKDKAGFRVWRDFYENDMNPQEAMRYVEMG
tara:strand:+ start:1557 stop:1721 length:165 start_codon:yes stop_codon:yes gene_type:complete